MRSVSVEERRRRLVIRHHLRGDAAGPDAVTAALIALHATDPATVYLSVLARSSASTLSDVGAALYDRRSLVRWMAMRRTLFVVATADVPMLHAAVGTALAGMLRRQLVRRIDRNGTEPPVRDATDDWLRGVETSVAASLRERGAASGAQLAATAPALRTTVLPGSASERPQKLTSPLLTLMGAEGAIVRGAPTGPWTSRHHRWEPADRWWPEGIPHVDADEARRLLARRWLERFGPATVDDLQWWSGWNTTTVRQALAALPVDDVDLHGAPGIDLAREADGPDARAVAPTATLLPSLDPTAMGWKHRDWYLSVDHELVFDTAGNIGPTAWWNGEAIGSWAVADTGEVRTVIVAERGAEAAAAIDAAAAELQSRLGGTRVTPSIRTRLERSLL